MNIPQIEWVVYKDISGLSREKIWGLAISSRSSEAIDHLIGLLKGVSSPEMATVAKPQVIVIVIGRNPIKLKRAFNLSFEDMVNLKSTNPHFEETQEIFLLPFASIKENIS